MRLVMEMGVSIKKNNMATISIIATRSMEGYTVTLHNSCVINFLNRKKNFWIILFFVLLLTLGSRVFGDYGISFDEPVSRENGAISLNHVLKHFSIAAWEEDPEILKYQTNLYTYRDRDYGVAFDMPAFMLERLLKINDSREQYLFKHFLTFLMFFVGVIAIYKLAARRFDDWKFGLLAALMFVLSPRMFAESFYNGKDIVLMAWCAIAMNTGIAFLLKPTFRLAIMHGITTGMAIDVRIVAVIFLVMTISIFIADHFQSKNSWRNSLKVASIYILVTAATVITFWPWLWSDPIANFLTAFNNMSKFRWENYNLYLGKFIPATQLPWHYPIVWIFITTPVLYSIAFLAGVSGVISEHAKGRFLFWNNTKQLQDIFFCGLCFGPLVAIIYFKSVLYDGWRQLYFIYPAFLLISVKGLVMLWNVQAGGWFKKMLFVALLSSQLIWISVWMWKVHPYQNLYFNKIADFDQSASFEMDYWGLTNLEGLKNLLVHDRQPTIRIAPLGATSLTQSIQLLPPEDRLRIQVTNVLHEADYIITNYRFFNGQSIVEQLKSLSIFYQLKIDGKDAFTIFKNVR